VEFTPTVSVGADVSGGFFCVGPDGVDPIVAVVAAKRTNGRDPASKLLGDTLASRATNVRAAADGTLVRTDYVNQFHGRTNPGRIRSVGWSEKNSPHHDG
jgi:hypothetical protein